MEVKYDFKNSYFGCVKIALAATTAIAKIIV